MMRRAGLFSVALLLVSDLVHADLLKPRAADFAAKYEPFTLILGPRPEDRRLVYGSYRGTLHLLENRKGALVEKTTRDLWSPVVEMVAADLDGDRQDEVVGYTLNPSSSTPNPRLFVLRGTDLLDIWNTQEGRFQSIKALTVADVDQDGQAEILLVADGHLRIFSGMQDIEEWKSTETYEDTEILVGDVNGDGKDDIVLNSGLVLGALFRDLIWKSELDFGTEMDLFDIDNDGKLEIIGLGTDGLLRVFDVDERRVKWN